MDCQTFRANHLAFLDDTLQEQALVAMQRHLAECEPCTRHDIAVRRGLMVLRSLPSIAPSPDFSARLAERLRAERILMEQEAIVARRTDTLIRVPRKAPFAAAAASVLLAAGLAVGAVGFGEDRLEPSLAPVVATQPERLPDPMAGPMFVAAASTGVPMWPAALLVEQAPAYFMTAELRSDDGYAR